MPWFKVDDTLHSHPKARGVGLAALGLWVMAGSYCSQYVTEGHVPEWFVTGIVNGRRSSNELVEAGLWTRVEGGYQFHDWDHYQITREEVERDKALNRARQRKFRESRREARARAIDNDA